MNEDILDIINKISNMEAKIQFQGQVEFKYESRYEEPVSWSKSDFVHQLGKNIPSDLTALWQYASRLHIYEETNFGQWGLIIWNPSETLQNNQSNSILSTYELANGDLIIGEFKGDLEKIVIRCDENNNDRGAITIASSIDPRNEWLTVARSLTSFLNAFIENPDNKYWEQ
jgi:hypothetical protein